MSTKSNATPKQNKITSFPRDFLIMSDKEEKRFPKDFSEKYLAGAAIGLDEKGIAHHFAPGLKFVGFLIGCDDKHAVVRSRGVVMLRIEDADDDHRKRPVYVQGPNEFSLDETKGSCEMGRLYFVEKYRSSVAFRRFDDPKPLNLELGGSL
jgi:hypothetical protein